MLLFFKGKQSVLVVGKNLEIYEFIIGEITKYIKKVNMICFARKNTIFLNKVQLKNMMIESLH